jgi:hypothetical protein
MRTATIKHRRTWLNDVCTIWWKRVAAKPDHWKSVTRTKLPTAPKAPKPADSGVAVGNGARICRLQDVTPNAYKHWPPNAFKQPKILQDFPSLQIHNTPPILTFVSTD